MGSIGPDQEARPMRHLAVLGGEGGGDAVRILPDADEPMTVMDSHPESLDAFEESLLDLGLADVHERREMLVAAVRQLDLEQLASAEIRAARAPPDSAGRDCVADAEARPDLEALPLHADGSGTDALGRFRGLEQVDLNALLCQAAGERQADRAGADDRNLSR